MKNKILFICAFLFFQIIEISAQTFEWAKRAGWYAFDLGYGIGTDDAGNVYIAGKYELKAYFGGTYVTNRGNHDIYVAKYGPDGSFKWVRTAGGNMGDYSQAMAVDGAGNVYITGEFETTAYFGSVAITTNGDNDIYFAKYNTNGDLIFAKKVGGGVYSDKGLGMSYSNGNIYITGRCQGTVNFPGVSLTGPGGRNIFVVKYTASGNFVWGKLAGSSGNDEGYAIGNDSAGNVYVTGYFSGTANFSGKTISSSGGNDIFLAKYNTNGDIQWVKKYGAAGHDYGMGVKVDPYNRVFLTGGFRYTTYFGSTPLKASGGDADMFVTSLNSSGDVLWARRGGGRINDYGRAIAVDNSSNVYITGNFGFSATFGSTTLAGVDSAEIYFASYDGNGNFRWALRAGGDYDASDPNRFIEMGLSIAVDKNRNVLASGAYRSKSTFGATTLYPWGTHTQIYVTKIRQGSLARVASNLPMITPGDTVSFCGDGNIELKTLEDTSYHYSWIKDGEVINGATSAKYNANLPGTYYVKVIDGSDTLISRPTVVTETMKINAEVTSAAHEFCGDSSVVLTANNGYNYIYQWKRNGEIIPGANSQTFKAEKPGNYQVKIIQGSCFDWSEMRKVTIQSCMNQAEDSIPPFVSGIEDETNDSLLVKLYPNPNNGMFTIEINMAQSSAREQIKIEVLNALGQVVYQKTPSSNSEYIFEHIELEGSLPTGIYFLQITVGDRVEKTKMLLDK